MDQFSTKEVLNRINKIVYSIVKNLDQGNDPVLPISYSSSFPSSNTIASTTTTTVATRSILNLSQSRAYTNILLVLSFVQRLLLSNRTTTNREVYYFFVTHFRSQRECDVSIAECCNMLGVDRIAIGLSASPKGWYCGCIEIIKPTSSIDGASLSSIQGLPITREWIIKASRINKAFSSSTANRQGSHSTQPKNPTIVSNNDDFSIRSTAKCIIVIEKEGVYTRLSEDRFFDRFPCILITGKGFPDIATRAMVYTLHQELDIPVYGICDCNPYGIAVLQTYKRGSKKREVEGGDRYSVNIDWIGLRPSQLELLYNHLPSEVYQELTDLDQRKITNLCDEKSSFMDSCNRESRLQELKLMKRLGYKVELESLHYLGMDYLGNWLEDVLIANDDEHYSAIDGKDVRLAI